MIATARGHIKMAMYLIDHYGADVHDRTEALHNAVHCSCSDPSSCELLSFMIENGGDVDAKTFGNCTPLMIAAERGQIKVVTYLTEHGVPTTRDYVNRIPANSHALDVSLTSGAPNKNLVQNR